MSRRTSPIPLLMTALVVLLGLAPTALAQMDRATQNCRGAIARSGSQLSRTILKAFTACHTARSASPSLAAVDCNDVASADLRGMVPEAEARFSSYIRNRCEGVDPTEALYEVCPSPCDAAVPTISDFSDVADCLSCLARSEIGAIGEAAFRNPVSPTPATERRCHRSIVFGTTRFLLSIQSEISRCQAAAQRAGATTTERCTQTDYDALVTSAYESARGIIANSHCGDVPLPGTALDVCGGAASADGLAACVLDSTKTLGQRWVAHLLDLTIATVTTTTTTTSTTTTSTTTTTWPVGDPLCPVAADFTLYSRDSNTPCTSNSDCAAPRTCDGTLGICTTTTEVDLGWTGLGHHSDRSDGFRLATLLYCAGPAGPTCGECSVKGVDPDADNCRCLNNNRTVCHDPFGTSADCRVCDGGSAAGESCMSNGDCPDSTCGGAAACLCYEETPTPVSFGGTPMCIVHQLAANVSGTVDVDAGAMQITTRMLERVHLGNSIANPCAVCGGRCSNNAGLACVIDDDCGGGNTCLQDSAGDGLRDGTCVGGRNDGLSCDVAASNASFPAREGAPGGGGYSLDCMPRPASNISGSGLAVTATHSTAGSTLSANVSCDGSNAGADCPCLTCSGHGSVACNSDAECASQAGFCSLASSIGCSVDSDCAAVDVGPCINLGAAKRCSKRLALTCATNSDCSNNAAGPCSASTCSSAGQQVGGILPSPNNCDDLACSDLGGGKGRCTTGPDEKFCDNVVRADGAGIYFCNSNADCAIEVIGVVGGNCSLVERRACFLDSIVAGGSADPEFPVTGATYCVPPTSSSGINSVTGLPGPARAVTQQRLTSYCGSGIYAPGGVGCP